MPWAPGIDFEQGKLFAQGLGAFGQEIGAGVQEALKRYHETQQQKSYAEGTFQAFSRNPDLRKYLIGDLKKGEDPQTALIRAQTEFEHAGTTKKMGIIQGAQVAATADIEEAKRRATLAEAGMYGAHQAYYAQLASQAKLAAENVEEFDPAKPGTFLLDSEGRVSAIRQRNVKTGAVTWKVPQYPIDVSGTPGFKAPGATGAAPSAPPTGLFGLPVIPPEVASKLAGGFEMPPGEAGGRAGGGRAPTPNERFRALFPGLYGGTRAPVPTGPTAAKPAPTPRPKTYANPAPNDINYLRAHPDAQTKSNFDNRFGPGSADRVLSAGNAVQG